MSQVEKSQFQTMMSQVKDKAIIGLDYIIYIIEAHIGNCLSNFHCVLCEENYKLQMIVAHLRTYVHRMKYLVSLLKSPKNFKNRSTHECYYFKHFLLFQAFPIISP